MKSIKYIGIMVMFLFLSACSGGFGEKKVFDGTEVYYLNPVTEAQATQLGDFLVANKFTDGTGKSVQLSRDADTNNLIFKMVVTKPEVADDPVYVNSFKIFTKGLKTEFNETVDFYVTDNLFETIKVFKGED